MTLHIDAFSDVACPWCYLGKRRLERALAARPDVTAEIVWHPFQLDPSLPREGVPYKETLARKFGGGARLEAAWRRIAEMGEAVGIHYAFEKIARSSNTFDAHRVVMLALDQGGPALEGRVKEALMAAHFEHGLDYGDRDALADTAERAGLDGALVREHLATGAGAERVRQAIQAAAAGGVDAVPLFIFAEKLAVPGAQDEATFARVIERVAGRAA